MVRELDPVLVERARAALADAAVIAEGKASKLAAPIKSGKPETRAPAGTAEGLFDVIAQAFARAQDDDALRLAIYQAESRIAAMRRAPTGRRDTRGAHATGDERSYALLTEWEGAEDVEVAAWEGVTIAHVRRLRFQNGRDPKTGRIVEGRKLTEWATPQERRARARALREADPNLSARAIAELLGVSHPTVLADLRATVADAA